MYQKYLLLWYFIKGLRELSRRVGVKLKIVTLSRRWKEQISSLSVVQAKARSSLDPPQYYDDRKYE